MKLEKIKFTDIVNDKLINKELELLKGGLLGPACTEFVCFGNQIDLYTNYCVDAGICKSGIK